MKLYEFMAKEIFARYGIPVPKGILLEKEGDKSLVQSYPVVLKSQILVGGRGKSGGIKSALDPGELDSNLTALLGMDIKGFRVTRVLAEEKLDIQKEFYIGIILDRGAGMPLLIASSEGGVEIESVPEDVLFKAHIHPYIGLQPFILRNLAEKLDLKQKSKELLAIVRALFKLFHEMDAELAEINPLVLTKQGDLVAADAKLTIDDNASFRHADIRVDEDLRPLEKEAKEKNITFIQLDGNIGVIANGAGLTMATLDCLNNFNGRGGVFLDLGGTDNPEKVKEAFVLMQKAEPNVIFLNIFGGITKCDTVALGIRDALKAGNIRIPIVARIRGRNEEEAKRILEAAGIMAINGLEEAAKKAAELGGF